MFVPVLLQDEYVPDVGRISQNAWQSQNPRNSNSRRLNAIRRTECHGAHAA